MAYSTSGSLIGLVGPIIGVTDPLLTNPAFVNSAIMAAKANIDSQCDRDFEYHTNVIEFHDGNGRDSLNTYYYPITNIYYVVMYNQLMQAMRVFLDTELIIQPEWGEIFLPPIYPAFMADKPYSAVFGNCFIHGRRNIEIKYDYGYVTPPLDIAMASDYLAGAFLLKSKFANISGGAGSRSIDGYSESFGNMKSNPWGSIAESWEQIAQQIVSRYKRMSYRSV